jgi:tetratricopeptide (TPR) repeat protein
MSTIASVPVEDRPTADRTAAVPADASELLALALGKPAEALAAARRLLGVNPDPLSASYAHQAAGIVLRDRGDLPAAQRELRSALRRARAAGSDERETDIQATLGATEVMAGRSRAGLARLEAAAARGHGLLLARIRLRRAHVLGILGRHDEALADLRLALTAARRSGDLLWEARILNNRCNTHLAIGALSRADADGEAAAIRFDQVGQEMESIHASHNRAVVAARRGDLPRALRMMDVAERRYQQLGVTEPQLVIDRGHALLAAGLTVESLAEADGAVAAGGAHAIKRAELLLFAARAALAAEQPQKARQSAREARRLFRAQQREGWSDRARLLEYQARHLDGERTGRLLSEVTDVARRLDRVRHEDAPLAYVLAARLAADAGRSDVVASSLAAAGTYRGRGPALSRATAWLAVAMLAAATPGEHGLLAACGHGLDALDEYRLLFGAAELRAVATWHARDLTEFAVDAATRRGAPRLMLHWTERSRATSLAEPSVRPADDPELERDLAAVRDAARRLEEAEESGASTSAARAQRDEREAAVRRRRRHLSGGAGSVPRLDLDDLLTRLGDARLVVLLESRGVLHAVHAAGGRVSRTEIGSLSSAIRELAFAQFALRRAAFGREIDVADVAVRLQRAVLGPVARRLDGDAAVIVVPPARLHAVPWGLLPVLADVPLTVAPSAVMWLRAAAVAARPVTDRKVLLVAGPDLDQGGAEVASLASVHRHDEAGPVRVSTTTLGLSAGAPPATIDRVVATMAGVWVTHIAAHGTFRADSPLFSSLRLDDGALYVHDFDRLLPAPRNVVLSACDSGVSAPVGVEELLGLVGGLLRVGSANVLASVGPVNDKAAVPFMSSVHRSLAEGTSLPYAARQGRRDAYGDDLAMVTAGSFNVWGA